MVRYVNEHYGRGYPFEEEGKGKGVFGRTG